MFKQLSIMIIITASVVSCGEKKAHTVKEFMDNENLRSEYLKKCNSGEIPYDDLNCINTRKAYMKIE